MHAALNRPFRLLGPWLVPLGIALGLGPLPACGKAPGDAHGRTAAGADRPDERDLERTLDDLVQAVTPPSPATAVAERNAWFGRRKATVERMRRGGPALGRAALARFRASEGAIPEVRKGLLDVAAHAAPEDTREVLVQLTTTYGDDLGLRAVAVDLLGRTSPQTAVEVLEPILETPHRRATYPPSDTMLEAYATACDLIERDPVPLLATVLMEPTQAVEARNFAAKRLGQYDTPRSRQALERIMVESGGNHLLRRFAAQSMRKLLPAEEFCTMVRELIDKEADTNYQLFLADILDRFCP